MCNQDLSNSIDPSRPLQQKEEDERASHKDRDRYDPSRVTAGHHAQSDQELRCRFREENQQQGVPTDNGDLLKSGGNNPARRTELWLARGNRVYTEPDTNGYCRQSNDQHTDHRSGKKCCEALAEAEII